MPELRIAKNKAASFEKHYVDANVSQFNASPSFMVKNNFAQYFQDIFIKPKSAAEDAQQECMTALYELVLSFESLERFVANPSSLVLEIAKRDLNETVKSWQKHFTDRLEPLTKVDARTKVLINHLKTQINNNTEKFLASLKDEENTNLRHIFAAHDLNGAMSLGRFIATNLDVLLVAGLKLAYHHSPYPMLNLLYVDRAIGSLSDAKKALHIQNFSLEGHFKTSAVHPYANTMLARLHPEKSEFETFAYPIPINNPSAAERLLRIKNNVNDTSIPLYQSKWWQYGLKIILSILDLIFLSLVVVNLLLYITLNCLNLISFKYFADTFSKFHQSCQDILNSIYTLLSPLHYFQAYENKQLEIHWSKIYSKEDMTILGISLVQENHVQKLLNSLHFPSPIAPIKPITLQELQNHLSIISIKAPPETKINQIQYQAENHFTSAVEMIGEIILLLDNYGIESRFRKSPVISTTGFCASLLTLAAYLNPSLIIPSTELLITSLQQFINQISIAFCGKAANVGLSEEIIGIFLSWQLNGMFLNIPTSLMQERLGWAEDSKHNTSKMITQTAMLAAFAYGVGMLQPIDINWDTLSPFKVFNQTGKYSVGVLVDFIDLIIEETHDCCHGTAVFANASQMVITLKGLLVLKNWLSSHDIHQPKASGACQEEASRNNKENDQYLQLKQYLYAIAHHDSSLLEASKQTHIAQEFYLRLKKELNDYNQKHDIKIDSQILLDNYFNLYCQSNYLNFCKLLIVPYILLSLGEFLAGHLYVFFNSNQENEARSEIYSTRAQKHLEGALLILTQSIYYAMHMFGTFVKVVWNYVIIGLIRALVTLVGEVCMLVEAIKNKSGLKGTQSYLKLCEIDDGIANCKIRNQVNEFLQPIYSFTASLAQSTGVYENPGPIAQRLLQDIYIQEEVINPPVSKMTS